jgi:hypothetical protein
MRLSRHSISLKMKTSPRRSSVPRSRLIKELNKSNNKKKLRAWQKRRLRDKRFKKNRNR